LIERSPLPIWIGAVAGPTPTNIPTAGHRFPEVLILSEALQPGTNVVLPVPVELVDELLVPVDALAHGTTV
jgi:hypothetical protein